MRLCGKNPVFERLRSKPNTIRKVYIQEGFSEASYVRKKAKQWGIPVLQVPRSKMLKMGRHINTQGVLVDVEDFFYTPYEDILELALKKKRFPVYLDGLNDPQNFGAIIRSLACVGQFSIILPNHGSVQVTEAVLRVASGGDNHVPIARVANLNKAIKLAKEAGLNIIGAVAQGGKPLGETPLPFPLGLVIGSEQKGIREVIQKQLDLALTIPMALDRLSLNVAQAATILCYEIAKQKIKKSKTKK